PSRLAVDAPAANAHVREQQDDEYDYEDYPNDHASPVQARTDYSSRPLLWFPREGRCKLPVAGKPTSERCQRRLDRLIDDLPRRPVGDGHAVAEHVWRQVCHVLDLNLLPALGGGSRFRPCDQMPRRARARPKLDARGETRPTDDTDA